MFKKIEIWILYLVMLLGIPVFIGFGTLVRQEIEGTTKKGNIDISFLTKPSLYIARLPEKFLITILKNPIRVNDPWDEQRYFYNQEGFNGEYNQEESYLLLSRHDGNLRKGIVELVDLTNFEVLHTWIPDINKLNKRVKNFDELKSLTTSMNNSRTLPYHPKLDKDGGLIFRDKFLRKIDACSNLIFQKTHDQFHHSIETDFDGNIWVGTFIYPQSLPIIKVGRESLDDGGYYDDAIIKLSSDGEILFEKSISQIFIDNGLENLLFGLGTNYEYDPLHLNDIQPINFDGEYWKKGDVFLSLRNQSMVLLYRPTTNEIIWKGAGPFSLQHDIDILDNYRISIFNNNAKRFVNNTHSVVDGNNEVIIYNFKTNEYSKYLSESIIENDVRTIRQGRSEILPNGDLFIEETNYGRTMYINSDGSLKWTHINKANDGNIYSIGWSRILHTQDDIQTVNDFLKSKKKCDI